jgi:hypothetical protein
VIKRRTIDDVVTQASLPTLVKEAKKILAFSTGKRGVSALAAYNLGLLVLSTKKSFKLDSVPAAAAKLQLESSKAHVSKCVQFAKIVTSTCTDKFPYLVQESFHTISLYFPHNQLETALMKYATGLQPDSDDEE